MAAVDFHRKSNSIIREYTYIYIYSRIEIRGVRFREILFPFLSSFPLSPLSPFFPIHTAKLSDIM